MNCFRSLCVASIGALVLIPAGRIAAGEEKPGECMLKAFAAKLTLNEDQQTELRRIHADFEKRSSPACQQFWRLQVEHHHAVLQILSPEQKQQLPEVMKGERDKMLEGVAKKLELTEEQKKQAAKICDETAAKFKTLSEGDDAKRPEKFQALKNERLEAFCAILTDDQRVKLPALMQEEMQAGRTPTAKSDLRNAIVEKLKLDDEQKQRLDKVCDESGAKIDEQKAAIRKMCTEMHASIEKTLNEEQKVKFQQFVKASGD